MRVAILLGVFLGLQGCSSRTAIRTGVDASTEVANQDGAPTYDSGGTTAEVGDPPDLPAADQDAPDGSADQALASADGNTVVDLGADEPAGPRETPAGGSFELRDDSPRVVAPDAGQCSPGFIRAYVFQFPAGTKTVKVIPVSEIRSFLMEGSLSDTSDSVLHYTLSNSLNAAAGELLVWRQGSAWFGQLTVYGSGPDTGCVRGELVFKYPI